MIKIICIGKLKEKYFQEAEKEYLKRLSKYTKIEKIEILDEDNKSKEVTLLKEKEQIKKHLKAKDNIIILDINAKEYDSIEFANLMNKELTYNSNITFIIGSSHGLDEEIKKLGKRISFSRLTFPHQMFRIMLLEQIYRSFKIINNEQYHK